ncbi:MAG: TPR end-of-group domain-containing protein [Bryobacteraceae bacterium]
MAQKKKKIAGPEKTLDSQPGDGALLNGNQLKDFEEAIRVFRAQNFKEARDLFLAAAEGPQKDIAYNARLHVSMCDRRLEKPAIELHTLDDHYNYAIERINARDLEAARRHLEIAIGFDNNADHVYYAIALCCGLDGDSTGAYENLKHAIDLQPGNRVAARQDADFAAVAHLPQIQQLLYPE